MTQRCRPGRVEEGVEEAGDSFKTVENGRWWTSGTVFKKPVHWRDRLSAKELRISRGNALGRGVPRRSNVARSAWPSSAPKTKLKAPPERSSGGAFLVLAGGSARGWARPRRTRTHRGLHRRREPVQVVGLLDEPGQAPPREVAGGVLVVVA